MTTAGPNVDTITCHRAQLVSLFNLFCMLGEEKNMYLTHFSEPFEPSCGRLAFNHN